MANEQEPKIPSYRDLMNPTLRALRDLGGSGSNNEIYEQVVENEEYTDDLIEIPHSEDASQTEVEYRIAWAKTYLKKYGLLENSKRGVWALTTKGWEEEQIDPTKVDKYVREQQTATDDELEEEKEKEVWKDKLRTHLLELTPGGFERLCQRILRESGFVEVNVTGGSGDQGLDGKGILKLSDLLSFHVVFQAKRWENSVGPKTVREFRGAMEGQADKGLIITTSTFTRGAKDEATKDGATPIDLVDGDDLIEMLKDNGVGVEVEEIVKEDVTISEEYFEKINEE